MRDALRFGWYLRAAVLFSALAILMLAGSISMLGVVLARLSGHSSSSSSSSSSDPPIQPTTRAAGYLCDLPASYTALPYARTWFVLGNAFAAGAGVDPSSNWISLLRALAKVRAGNAATLVNVAQQGGSLSEQVRAVRQTSAYKQLVSDGGSALVFVSYGVEVLEANAASASLASLASELEQIYGGNASLIAPGTENQFLVLLVARPDPIHGGVYVPPGSAVCPSALAFLNSPTIPSYAQHTSVYAAQRALYSSTAHTRAFGFVDTDAALGLFSWAFARNKDASAFADCELYNELGHSLLAELLWSCMQRQAYTASQ